MTPRPSRRRFLAALTAGAGTFVATRNGAPALGAQAQRPRASLAALPTRRETVIRNAYVITVDDTLRDVAGGDVHIRDGVIAAVGRGLRAPGAEQIDARGMIVMPGFVDTHWHMWNGVFRGMTHTPTEYFALQRLAQHFTPADHYTSIAFNLVVLGGQRDAAAVQTRIRAVAGLPGVDADA